MFIFRGSGGEFFVLLGVATTTYGVGEFLDSSPRVAWRRYAVSANQPWADLQNAVGVQSASRKRVGGAGKPFKTADEDCNGLEYRVETRC